jgi:hypothetical protein
LNLFDRLRSGARSFASPAKPAPQQAEIGIAGDFNAFYNKEEFRSDTIRIEDYRRMLDNDGTVEAVYNLMTLPIMASGYHFEVDGKAEKLTKGAKELQLVQDNFSLPPHQGGMSLPFELLIGDMLRGIAEGFRLYEKVWTLSNGKIVYKKLAPRDASTVHLQRDENGGFAGAFQRAWNGTEYVEIEIPIDRCFLFTYAKWRSFLYGRSAFKSAYYHYDRKHKLYYLQQLGAQTAAVPPRKLGVPDSIMNNADKLAEAEAAADNFGVMQRITLPEGFTLDEYKTSPKGLTEDINHHDALIARSLMAQFIVLGQQGKGSFALSKDQTDLFTQALQGTMRQIEHHINAFLIPDLIDFNFGTGIYPEFKFEEIDNTRKDLLNEAFKAILTRADMPGYAIQNIVDQVAMELGFEATAEQLAADQAKAKADAKAAAAAGTDPTAKQDPQKPAPKKNADGVEEVRLSDGYFRSLTDAEQRVNLSGLTKQSQSAEDKLKQVASDFYSTLKDDTVKRLTTLLNKGDLAGLKQFQLGSFQSYRKALEEAMMAQYLYGKRIAADEITGKIPQTPAKSRQYITTQAAAVADKQANDLAFLVKNEATKELRKANLADTKNLGVTDIMARIASLFGLFTDSNVGTGIGVSLAGSLNLGRNDSFAASDDIDRMQYSAILDNRTTQICKDLDGSVVSYEEYAATKWIPPCHFGCRSIWVAILKDDSFKPEFRPIPARPGGITEPQL